MTAHGDPTAKLPSADQMDEALHRDRLIPPADKRTHRAEIVTLPDGVFLLHGDEAWLLWQSSLLHWTPGGYDRHLPQPTHGEVTVLTPRAIVRTIAAGYAPSVHPSAQSVIVR